jgi:uncharacterized membrane protein
VGDDLSTSLAWASTTPQATWAVRRFSLRPPVIALVLAICTWSGVFALHAHWRHVRFGTFDHDLAIWDQAVWLLSQGQSLITVRGLDVFGFHASPALYLYVPFYWLGAGPTFLTVSMVGMFALGAVAVFRAARFHLTNEWHALILAVAFLVNYAGQWMLHETFHPEVMAITPLLFAYLAAVEGRWRAYLGWMVFALAWKEDVALAGLMLGVVLAIRGSRTVSGRPGPADGRRMGWYTIGACALWFVIATQVLIPAFSDAGNFTEGLYGDLGGSPTEIAETAITDPSVVVEHLEYSDPPHYAADLFASFGFVPLAAPLILLMGLPQALINLLAIYDFFWTTRVHYAALPLLATTLAAVEGVARARTLGIRRFFLGLVTVGAFYTAIAWGVNPASPVYRDGHWPLFDSPIQRELEEAVQLPADDDAVSAAYNLVPHLSHREQVYTFPNPWVPVSWGVAGENRPDPDDVDWIIVEPNLLNLTDKGLLVAALQDPADPREPGEELPPVPAGLDFAPFVNTDEWEVVIDGPDLFAVRRVR